MEPRKISVNLVMIGDRGVGKTSLRRAYVCKSSYKSSFSPDDGLYDAVQLKFGNKSQIELGLEIYEGPADNDIHSRSRTRHLLFQADLIMLCYSCDDTASLENVELRWIDEIRESRENLDEVPLFLVGTKTDLKRENSPNNVTNEEVNRIRTKIGAKVSMQCSVETSGARQLRTSLGANEVFRRVIDFILAENGIVEKQYCFTCTIL